MSGVFLSAKEAAGESGAVIANSTGKVLHSTVSIRSENNISRRLLSTVANSEKYRDAIGQRAASFKCSNATVFISKQHQSLHERHFGHSVPP